MNRKRHSGFQTMHSRSSEMEMINQPRSGSPWNEAVSLSGGLLPMSYRGSRLNGIEQKMCNRRFPALPKGSRVKRKITATTMLKMAKTCRRNSGRVLTSHIDKRSRSDNCSFPLSNGYPLHPIWTSQSSPIVRGGHTATEACNTLHSANAPQQETRSTTGVSKQDIISHC